MCRHTVAHATMLVELRAKPCGARRDAGPIASSVAHLVGALAPTQPPPAVMRRLWYGLGTLLTLCMQDLVDTSLTWELPQPGAPDAVEDVNRGNGTCPVHPGGAGLRVDSRGALPPLQH